MNVMVAINLKIWTNKKYGICVDNLVALNKDVFNTDIVILCIENIELGLGGSSNFKISVRALLSFSESHLYIL